MHTFPHRPSGTMAVCNPLKRILVPHVILIRPHEGMEQGGWWLVCACRSRTDDTGLILRRNRRGFGWQRVQVRQVQVQVQPQVLAAHRALTGIQERGHPYQALGTRGTPCQGRESLQHRTHQYAVRYSCEWHSGSYGEPSHCSRRTECSGMRAPSSPWAGAGAGQPPGTPGTGIGCPYPGTGPGPPMGMGPPQPLACRSANTCRAHQSTAIRAHTHKHTHAQLALPLTARTCGIGAPKGAPPIAPMGPGWAGGAREGAGAVGALNKSPTSSNTLEGLVATGTGAVGAGAAGAGAGAGAGAANGSAEGRGHSHSLRYAVGNSTPGLPAKNVDAGTHTEHSLGGGCGGWGCRHAGPCEEVHQQVWRARVTGPSARRRGATDGIRPTA